MTKSDTGWALILAAGAGTRFGGVKPLTAWGDMTLLSHASALTQQLIGFETMTVVGARAEQVRACVDGHVVINEDWQKGMGNSIACGVEGILKQSPQTEMIVLMPVDQPLITTRHLEALVEAARNSGRCALTGSASFYGPPAAVPSSHFDLLRQLRGESGLKSVLATDDYVYVQNERALMDADTEEQLDNLRQLIH